MKRSLAIALLCLILVPVFMVSVSANTVYTNVAYQNGIYIFTELIPEGQYSVDCTCFGADGSILGTFNSVNPVTVKYEGAAAGFDEYSGCAVEIEISNYPGEVFNWEFVAGSMDGQYGCTLVSDGGFYQPQGASFEMRLVPVDAGNGSTALLDPVTDSLSAILDWVGTVVSSLVDGELSSLLPLFAIGIAVSALFLGIKAIRGFTWGA